MKEILNFSYYKMLGLIHAFIFRRSRSELMPSWNGDLGYFAYKLIQKLPVIHCLFRLYLWKTISLWSNSLFR